MRNNTADITSETTIAGHGKVCVTSGDASVEKRKTFAEGGTGMFMLATQEIPVRKRLPLDLPQLIPHGCYCQRHKMETQNARVPGELQNGLEFPHFVIRQGHVCHRL